MEYMGRGRPWGVPKRSSKQHQHRRGVAIMYRDTANLKIEQHCIIDRARGFSHQAVSWTIRSPLITSPIHITAIIFPHVDPIGSLTCSRNPHPRSRLQYACRWKFRTPHHSARKNQVPFHVELAATTDDTCPHQVMPTITPARLCSPQRGCLLLRMLNATSVLILNGWLINDYNVTSLQNSTFQKVKTCYVIHRPWGLYLKRRPIFESYSETQIPCRKWSWVGYLSPLLF